MQHKCHPSSSKRAECLQPQFMVSANMNNRWIQSEQQMTEHSSTLVFQRPFAGDDSFSMHSWQKNATGFSSTFSKAPARNLGRAAQASAIGQGHLDAWTPWVIWGQSWESYMYPSQRKAWSHKKNKVETHLDNIYQDFLLKEGLPFHQEPQILLGGHLSLSFTNWV